MLGRGRGGKIVNIASMLSFQGGIRVASYTASKSGLAGLTKILANEWAAEGHQRQRDSARLHRNQEHQGATGRRIAQPRNHWRGYRPDAGDARTTSVARPYSSHPRLPDYVHGIVLPVDGGWLAR